MAGERKYPDLRYLFMRGLIKHERDQRCHHYLKSAAECTSRAIVSLELADEPIRSVKQARKLEGIGGETCLRLTKLEKEKEFSSLRPLGGRYVSSAGGILVALLDATEEIRHRDNCSPEKIILVPEENVKSKASRLTEEHFTDGINEFCKAWWRLEVLIKRGYIRRRSQKKSPVLQLMPIGKDIALRLRAKNGLTSTVPNINLPSLSACPVPRLSSLCSGGETTAKYQNPELEDVLYTNDNGQDSIVLLVDRREMGGEKNGLGELCGLLDQRRICYKTQHLKIGDYSWMWRVNSKQIILPCLVERKRADDIVRTLLEGRFWSQVNKMKEWKQDFTERGIQCAIHYILERKPEEYVVRCDDGCQGLVKCGNPSLTQVKMVIEDLKRYPDLLVKETDNLNITVILLASITAELKERVKKGDFDQLLKQVESKEKSLSCETKTLVENLPVDITLNKQSDGIERIVANSLPHDLSFDEEMTLAMERSRAEMSQVNEILKDIKGSNGDKLSHSNRSMSRQRKQYKESNGMGDDCVVIVDNDNDDRSNVVVIDDDDDEYDYELALVLERSKYDCYNEKGVAYNAVGRSLPKTRPLMQYHCSVGGSLNYPSSSEVSKENYVSTYRPKINQKQSESVRSPKQMGSDSVSSPKQRGSDSVSFPKQRGSDKTVIGTLNTVTDKDYCGGVVKFFSSSTSVRQCTATSQASYTDAGTFAFKDSESIVNVDLLYESPTRETSQNKQPVKMKQGMKDLVLQPDEHCIEESNVNENVLVPKKKPRTSEFNFTPSKDCIEINVVQTSNSNGGNCNKGCKQNPGGKLGKDSKGRKRKGEDLNISRVELESDMRNPLKVEHKEISEGTVVCEDVTKVFEGDDNNGYCSEEDIFADTDSTGDDHNVTFDDIYTVNVDKSGQNCDLLSRSSDSQDSLPDIDLDISTAVKHKLEESSSQNFSTVGYNTCTASTFYSNNNEIHFADYKDSDQTRDWSQTSSKQERIDSGYDSDALNITNSEMENKIELVRSVLPHIDKNSVSEMLNKCDNNVELCVTRLLEANGEM